MAARTIAVGPVAVLALAGCGDDEPADADGPVEVVEVLDDVADPVDSVPVEGRTAELEEVAAQQPLLGFSDETYAIGAPIVAPFLGLPLDEFTREVVALGLGPVRVVEGDGRDGEPTADLVPGRVDVVAELRDGVLHVSNAAVETDMGPAADFVGAPLEDLLDEADDGPWPHPIRIIEQDGERLPIVDDGFDPRRVNVVVEDGIVVAIDGIG